MKIKFINPFKRKTDPTVHEVIEAKRTATDNKNAMAEKVIKMMREMQKPERRCGILDYHGPERRQVNA